MKTIAIHPDFVRHRGGQEQSFSDRWSSRLVSLGGTPQIIDSRNPCAIERISECDGFMWRYKSSNPERSDAERFLHGVEQITGLRTFPSLATRWYVDDKVTQARLFRSLGIPHPRTYVFFDHAQALEFARNADYPFVIKLRSGRQSSNVRLITSSSSARAYIDNLFGKGLYSLQRSPRGVTHETLRRMRRVLASARGINVDAPTPGMELHHGYLLAQEFIAGNECDTRITVVGNRAFAFRRFNRPEDFRASGSGLIDWDPSKVDSRMVQMALDYKNLLGAQTVAFDFVKGQDGEPLVLELSLSYASWIVNECPGSWTLDETNDQITWEEGRRRVEDEILLDFLCCL